MHKPSPKPWKESDPVFMLAFVMVLAIAILVFLAGIFIIIHFVTKYW
jgi:hypothetical protein